MLLIEADILAWIFTPEMVAKRRCDSWWNCTRIRSTDKISVANHKATNSCLKFQVQDIVVAYLQFPCACIMRVLLQSLRNHHEPNVTVETNGLLCENETWIASLMEECVQNLWEFWSATLGLASIGCFLFAALPQMYLAYKNAKVDHALSIGFLLCWGCGDVTNFIGCYLTNQLLIQTVTAHFYVILDSIMISQFVYYKMKNRKGRHSLLKWLCVSWVLLCVIVMMIILHLLRTSHHSRSRSRQRSTFDFVEFMGYISGYMSCIFYLGSRFPQLYKNFQRKSTEGTSYLPFALAMLGNTTYGLSVAVNVPENKASAKKYILHHLAWLIGSFGVLLVDFLITAQFIRYRKRSDFSLRSIPEVAPLLDDEEEQLNNFAQLH
ncbi:lysosomal amino acid transporter 1 homolog [Scyliorhinus canicula]|uniref:lysosomal amino acid transporter 1 homolog n=1 Tax=Scyliorhinus canicula TaxID=7830 RepID=UPI0018F66675|nr:lysosomal amino acid transporter 1 homolog [Scyliorhinus canicula]